MRHPLPRKITETVALHGEYWYTPDNDLIFADGDVGDDNHSTIVYKAIISIFCGVSDMEDVWDGDVISFRSDVGNGPDGPAADMLARYAEKHGVSELWDIDPWDAIKELAVANGVKAPVAERMHEVIGSSNGMDAREFAIKYWHWIRCAGSNFELPNSKPDTLKRVAEAVDAILDEQGNYDDNSDIITVTVSLYNGRRTNAKVGDLRAGLLVGDDADDEKLRVAAARNVARMDQEIASPHYRGHLGDARTYNMVKLCRLLESAVCEGLQSELDAVEDALFRKDLVKAQDKAIPLWPHLQWMDGKGRRIMKDVFAAVARDAGGEDAALKTFGGRRSDLTAFDLLTNPSI